MWSSRLYGPFINGLLADLRKSELGPILCAVLLSSLGFADDVAILTLNKHAMNRQLAVADSYSCRWCFLYSPSKSLFMTFGPDKQKEIDIKLHNTVLKKAKQTKHVGVPLCVNRASESIIVTERINSCKNTFNAMIAASSAGFDPVTLSRLYFSKCTFPKLLYGVEVWQLGKTNMDRMETTHSEIGKRIQGLHRSTATPASYILLGWLPLCAYTDIRRLVLLLTLLKLPFDTAFNSLTVGVLSRRRCAPVTDVKTI